MSNCEGLEQLFLMELVRSLDEAAFAFMLASNRSQLRRGDRARHTMLRGAARAIGPLLKKVHGLPGGIPVMPTTPELARLADDYLLNCGRLSELSRIAALERYGLCKSTFLRDDHIVFEVVNAEVERHDVESLEYLRSLIQEGRSDLEVGLLSLTPTIHKQLDEYVRVDREHFIAYDNDEALVAYYHALAALRSTDFFESEALVGSVSIGGRTFGGWCDRAVAASGRVLQHAAFASRLKTLHARLELRNLLTIFARKEDLAAVLEQFGDTPEQARRFISATTLDEGAADGYAEDYEIPVPLYIDFSRDFVLLPCFGALLNPIAGLVRSLRTNYRSEWDRAVECREAVFRSDLSDVFTPPRFVVLDRGVRLRRGDGSELTDVDAILLDRTSGALALFQLKWHDIVGRSLRERHSRRLNLLKANQWVDRVSDWINGRSAADIASALGLELPHAHQKPYLFVVSRYAAQFAGNEAYDPRAAWLAWGDIVRGVPVSSRGDVIDSLARAFAGGLRSSSPAHEATVQSFNLPGLTVELRLQ